MSKKRLLSFIIPVFNEKESLSRFLTKHLLPIIKNLKKYRQEIIFINDGSTDGTAEVLKEFASQDPNLKVITFSRNFGKEAALSAGFQYAKGDAVISIDSDGEQPPSMIPRLVKEWEKGAQVVTVVRRLYGKRGFFKKATSKLFYKLLGAAGNKTTRANTTDYRLLDRVVVDEFNKMTEHGRITRGLIDWMGFKTATVPAVFTDRIAGKPSYDTKKLIKLAVDSFISMSTTPLVIFGYIGGFITVGSFLLGLFVIIEQYIMNDPMHLEWSGAVHMAIFMTFLVGLVLISQAITALYISRIHAEAQNRPLFVVDQKNSHNLD